MNISRYINFVPYLFAWHTKKLLNNQKQADFYCGNIVDYFCFKKVLQHYPKMRVVAKNKKVRDKLKEHGVKSILYPTFPDTVVMCRHSARKYPLKQIKKIGLRHGPYHFKNFINPRYYNEFDSYLFTSEFEAKEAKEIGITNGQGPGYPKIDDAFDGTISESILNKLKKDLGIDSNLPTIIFSATWNKTNYSAINKWYDKINTLVGKYNILVTVHDWTTQDIKDKLKHTKGIHYIEDKEILKYLMISDLMIGDISSIIAEFSALDKAIITFRIEVGKRTTKQIIEMLDNMTYRVDSFEELEALIDIALADNGEKHRLQRQKYNEIMFGQLDGKANLRVKTIIDNFIEG